MKKVVLILSCVAIFAMGIVGLLQINDAKAAGDIVRPYNGAWKFENGYGNKCKWVLCNPVCKTH